MALFTPRRLVVSALAAAAFTLLPSAQVVHASAQPLGTILVRGSDWAGASSAMGDLNVYSNGPTFTGPYQCTQLVMRWAAIRYSESSNWTGARSAADMWRVGPMMPVPFEQLRNGGAVPPAAGDILVYDVTAAFPTGHVSVVTDSGPGYVNTVEQNGSWTGRATLPINGTTMPPRQASNQPIIGWLRASGAPYAPTAGVPGGQILDSWGGIHPFGSASPVTATAYWPGWSIARDIGTQKGHPNSGYVLDGWGGVHAFGAAPVVRYSAYWPGWDIARKLVLRADGHSGYVLDGWGGLHAFGVAGDMPPAVSFSGYWPGWDIARAVVLRSDGVSGYVMDGFGGLHPFGQVAARVPNLSATPYWQGWNVARGVALASDSGGYIVDAFGGVHAFGTAAQVAVPAYFGADVARGIILSDPDGGYVVFQTGEVRAFGSAPSVNLGLMCLPLGQAVS